jgi:hypothetical protein
VSFVWVRIKQLQAWSALSLGKEQALYLPLQTLQRKEEALPFGSGFIIITSNLGKHDLGRKIKEPNIVEGWGFIPKPSAVIWLYAANSQSNAVLSHFSL